MVGVVSRLAARLQNCHHVALSDRNTASLGAGNHRLPNAETLSQSRLSKASIESGHADIVRDTVRRERERLDWPMGRRARTTLVTVDVPPIVNFHNHDLLPRLRDSKNDAIVTGPDTSEPCQVFTQRLRTCNVWPFC